MPILHSVNRASTEIIEGVNRFTLSKESVVAGLTRTSPLDVIDISERRMVADQNVMELASMLSNLTILRRSAG